MILFASIFNQDFNSSIGIPSIKTHLSEMGKTGFNNVQTIVEEKSIFTVNLQRQSHSSQSEIVLEGQSGYSSNSNELAEFCEIKISGASDALKLQGIVDSFASCPLFYFSSESLCCVSNDTLAIAKFAQISDLNQHSLYELFTNGHCITEETTISGIKRLWPSQTIEIQFARSKKTNLKIIQRERLEYKSRSTNVATCAESIFKDLINSAEHSLKISPRFVLQISGGLDSRITAGALRLAHPKIEINATTLNIADQREMSSAELIGTTLNLKHTFEDLEIRVEDIRSGFLLTGGQASCLAAGSNMQMYNRNNKDEVLGIIGAWPGDCLIGSYIPNHSSFLSIKKTRKIVKRYCWNNARMSRYLTTNFFVKSASLEKRFGKKQSEMIMNSSGNSAAQKISYWAMFHRQPTFSHNSPARLTSSIQEITPMLHAGYVEKLLTLTSEEIFRKNFYRTMLIENLPKLAEIDYNGEPLSHEWAAPSFGFTEYVLYSAPRFVLNTALRIKERINRSFQIPISRESTYYGKLADEFTLNPDHLRKAFNNPKLQMPLLDFSNPLDVDRFWKILTIQLTWEYLNN